MILGVVPVITVILFLLAVVIVGGIWVALFRDLKEPFMIPNEHENNRLFRIRSIWLIIAAISVIAGAVLWVLSLS